ncbi:hypothetical protein [Mesobacillus selenatarsenatis]|nr:hypothetical protein [Mesobacillus selenatarsenatis]
MLGFEDIMVFYSVAGFYLTLLGTIFGIASLIFAIYISKTANKIKQNLMKGHIQEKYKKTKSSILKSLSISYKMVKEERVIDIWSIQETIISLSLYNEALSKDTKVKIKKLKKTLKRSSSKSFLSFIDFTNYDEEIGFLIYELVQKLESDFDEKENYLEVMTK